MPRTLTQRGIAHLRLRNQRLTGPRLDSPVDVIQWLGAVQAQDYPGAKWAVAQRTSSADSASIDRDFDRGDILRTHAMRPTWHFVAPRDIRWLLQLTAPRIRSVMATYNRTLELTDAVFLKANRILAAELSGNRHLTRREIAAALEKRGIATGTPRLSRILMNAELDALVCSGPLRDKQFTYALLEVRVPPAPPLSREQALATLTRRYFDSHGPATSQDYAWWSGLRMPDVRAGIELVKSHLIQETIGGRTYLMSAAAAPRRTKAPVVHLLPNYDEHIVAYRDHGPSFDSTLTVPSEAGQPEPMPHFVTLNGLIIGGWRRTVRSDRIEIATALLRKLDRAESRAFERAGDDYAKFMGLPVRM
ncbi:MAG: winged helix DNA-binding domain-containing protein [Gemmatimonadales bacterium]